MKTAAKAKSIVDQLVEADESEIDNLKPKGPAERILKGPVSDPGWEHNSVYTLEQHPFRLVVVTNADQADWDEAKKIWDERNADGTMANIEDILQEMGFFAATGQQPQPTDS